VGTEVEVIASLEAMGLEMWQARCDALPQRFQQAQREASKLIEPKVVYVTLPSATIHNEAELEAWLAQVRKQVERLKYHSDRAPELDHLASGEMLTGLYRLAGDRDGTSTGQLQKIDAAKRLETEVIQ